MLPHSRLPALFCALLALSSVSAPAGILEDRAIEDAIQSSFVFRELLADPTMVQIYVRYGAVEVRGQVADEHEHLLVGDLIAALPHVRTVDNRLFVDSAHRRSTYLWLGGRIRAHLLMQASVEVEKLTIRVSTETIQFGGRVRDAAQSDLIATLIGNFSSGRMLRNQLEISPDLRPRRAIDDASVTALAWGALRTMPTLQLSPRAITSEGGHVSIVGIGAAPGDLVEVASRLSALRGVQRITNQVIVAP